MSLLSWLYGDDENAQRAAQADADLRALNERRAALLGQGWQAQVNKDFAAQQTFGVQAQSAEIDSAFNEGWQDGQRNITGAVSGFFKVIANGLSAVLFGIPFWVWLAAGIAVWVYLGAPGLKKLKGKFA